MKREVEKILISWRQGSDRKVLLLRGARQVGKTYSMRTLGKSFKYFLEVNFEEDRTVKQFFSGSLLEFALSQIPSYGVGRISSLFMYPMSFDEFLYACAEEGLVEMKSKAGVRHPLDDVFHQKLIDYLKIFYLIGGMPEVVNEYVKTKNILLCQDRLGDLIETLKDDFAKYKNRSPVQRLREVFDSIGGGVRFQGSLSNLTVV